MKCLKLLILCFLILFLNSCGYKNLNSTKLNSYKIDRLDIKGDRKIVYKLRNNLEIYSDSNSNHTYNVKVDLITIKENKIKNTAGKTTRYSKILQADIAVTNTNNQNEFRKTFSSTNNYDVGSTYSDTLNNEKYADKNNLAHISNEIVKYLKLLSIK